MTRIAIVGGHGKIARLLIPVLAEAGHQPVALVRNPDHTAELEDLGAEVALLDIEKSGEDDFAKAFDGAGAIVFAAGGGADGNVERKKTVDLGGSLKSIAGAGTAGVRRFVQISAMGVDEPVGDDVEDAWRAYVDAKRDADIALRDSDLDWTIIRPGALTDDAPTGRIQLAERAERSQVPRADVAAVIAAVLDDPRTHGKQWELVSGDTPIADAITAAVR
ncbi:SDR family oxidoreductase [Aeromicrobium wangtongii]|uniref:SDR family oxidoreductase n=1 Tax=Aeromicrobium wangtongii TaxID=2969247 RepID=A0ABY5M957_9ACTN|nr:SDR family oxidoreductase [Aeromicrobium wangtongii]MCD9200043.1 SDR family oxidoreductase [Aeromicrobium wangtongii]MCL3820235.1 SDR family oxidoreductase [Aeromicrobium wangtongii]UUP13302.1 SDR family oxidoreductase [Aeromicrobium wangtongii]